MLDMELNVMNLTLLSIGFKLSSVLGRLLVPGMVVGLNSAPILWLKLPSCAGTTFPSFMVRTTGGGYQRFLSE